jgi:GINS complex subunit 2
MAVNLKLKKKCRIVAPDWLNVGPPSNFFWCHSYALTRRERVEFLQECLSFETSNAKFSHLPFRFAEVAKVVLDVYVHVIYSPFYLTLV